ncbi:acyltransferase family protein [Pseudomonas koreensis]|uniref:Acyltransferase n=1 Tax=Pseudomonas koreensis TaxID=198620 RepID=A0A9X2XFB9_9PSED|nr:acyltransferase [Pseudomonas koreensis]MCU7247836.1 acyltransferase [Pseudomonas koreensis]
MGTKQIGGLTALRFFAAFSILIHHAKGNFFPPDFLWDLPLDGGVTFFFVLSGFILSHVYSRRGINGGLGRFYVARFARLWPAHAFCTLMLLACIPYQRDLLESANNVYVLILNLMMLHAGVPIPDVYFSFNAVSWSISTEIFFYMAFPLLLLWFSSKPVLKLGAAIVLGGLFAYALDVAGMAYYAPEKLNEVASHGLVYISPLGRIQEFMLGIVCQRLLAEVNIGGMKKEAATVLEIISILAIVFITPLLRIYTSVFIGASAQALSEFVHHSAMALLFAAVISCFYMDRGLVSRILSWRPLVFLGEISFSVYLIHQVIIRLTTQEQLLAEYGPYTRFWFVAITSIACAAFIWKFVEKPCQKGIMRIYDSARTKLNPSESTN